MKRATLVVASPYVNNEVFKPDSKMNRDGCLDFFRYLKDFMREKGFDLQTQDLHPIQDSDLVIYNDMPATLPSGATIEKSVLFIYESELIVPANWDRSRHTAFKKIFTWNDQLLDGKKYFKLNFTHTGRAQFLPFEQKTEFITLIAGQHYSKHPFELYSKRIEAIRFYEKNHPGKFAFYGMGWNLFTFKGPKIIRALNRVRFLRKLLAPKWPSYRGPVQSKIETLKRYKFSICFENGHSLPGYITEKIFDSLVAGCIPVYWGAPNITNYIPKECFVDFRDFGSFEKLHSYLETMGAQEYNSKLKAIENYLSSESYQQFLPRPCAQMVSSHL